jgi:hypothetical protein
MVDDENSDVVANAAEQKVIRGHRRICSKTYFKRHRGTQSADFAGPNPLFERFGRPDVVAIEADELPADRSDVAEEFVVQCFALGAKLCRAVSIGIVPRSRSVTCSRGMPPTECGPPNRAPHARRSTATSKRGIMPESLEYDLEQIL